MVDTKTLTPEKLAGMNDQTNLKNYIPQASLEAFAKAALPYGFKTLAVNNAPIPFLNKILEGSSTVCDAAVSFPFGQCTIETKVFETKDVIAKGAGEVDYVCNIVELKSGHWDYIEEEMRRIVDVCNEHGIVSKVIFENCYLTDDEKKRMCEAALKVRPTFIKTSTGFGSGGAAVEDVRLMKSMVGDELKIKAAGGIRSAQAALDMIRAGAERIGTSRGIEIIEEFKRLG